MKNKTIIVSNRLPLNVSLPENEEENEIKILPSVGGLATGMKSIHQNSDSLWIGWSGIATDDIDESTRNKINKAIQQQKCISVDLTQDEVEDFYFGFSNDLLWPLFHYFTEYTHYKDEHWEAYKKVNRKFAEKVLEHLEDGDQVWVHDYQLLLLPQLIKEAKPNVSIGFFLHIPFPSYEIFRVLPKREELLKGMLGSDLIGFHNYDYERHFISSVSRILRYDVNFNTIQVGRRKVKIDSFPMGIDYQKFKEAAIDNTNKSQEEKSQLKVRLEQHLQVSNDAKLILSIDRLDYTKGIAQRLKAFEYFLTKYPQFQEKARLVMLAVPSRENVPQYQRLKREIDELVGRINGKFSTVSWTPVWYFYRSLPFEQLIDLYTSCEIALLTPIRDGMNLVAKEYIASRTDRTGTLILSEMAGAAQEMSEALIINPNDSNQIAEALKVAFEMPEEEQIMRNKFIQKRIKRYDVEKWATEFMKSLEATKDLQKEKKTKWLNEPEMKDVLTQYRTAQSKIFFLDYDGTLVNFHPDPHLALPDAKLYTILDQLITNNNDLVIISGRDKDFLEQQFGHLPVTLIAEHGVWTKKKGKDWIINQSLNNNWMDSIRPIMENFVDRTPGSFLEEKNYSLVWHYRKTDPVLGEIRANELSTVLTGFLSNHNIAVLKGNKALEVKNGTVNKGAAANRLLNKTYDFVFAIGDDRTDEFMFRLLPKEAVSVKVGNEDTSARYFIDDTDKVRQILLSFTENTEETTEK